MAELLQTGLEPVPLPTLGELLARRREAGAAFRNSEIAILSILQSCQKNHTPILITGYPATVGLAHKDEATGQTTGYTEIPVAPLIGDKEATARTIERGFVKEATEMALASVVRVQPEGAENYWTFYLNNVLDIERLDS